MKPNRSSKASGSGFSPCKALLSFGLPLLLVLLFLGKQFVNLDSIDWSHGFSHPLSGWDHLLTMLAVGIWAAQLRGQAIWMLPLAFVGVMSLGGLAGAAGLAIPSVEGVILLSCAVFCVLITRKVRFSSQINVLIVAFFAFFHGFAHGQEISTSASLISYTLGFMLATLLLHGAGILVAKLVVLAVTCLLTVVFSSAALAKTADSIIDIKGKNAAFAQESGIGKVTSFGMEAGRRERDGCFVFNEDNLSSEDFSRHCAGGDGRSSINQAPHADMTMTPLIGNSEKIKADSNSHASILKNAPLQALEDRQDKLTFDLGYISGSSLDFRHYYPDINHTPGKHLLSNGVGLTSPPVLFIPVLAPQISPDLCKTSISSIEDSHLQLTFAKFAAGNSATQTTSICRHDYALRNPGNALQIDAAATRCKNNFASSLTPFDNSTCMEFCCRRNFQRSFPLCKLNQFAVISFNSVVCEGFHSSNITIKINGHFTYEKAIGHSK